MVERCLGFAGETGRRVYGFGDLVVVDRVECCYFSHQPSSLFHHSVLVDLSVSMMMH